MLENLRDFPRSLFGLQYQNYSDGILYGCDITGTETGMILLPGILCYKGVPYFLERPYPVTCKAEGKMAYVKVHFWDKTIGSGGEEYLSQIIVDEQEPDAEQELELARFKLQAGARLRSDYVDFYDYETEFDTVNRIYVPYAALDHPGIWPQILKSFARELLKYAVTDPWDCAFCLQCLQRKEAMKKKEKTEEEKLEEMSSDFVGECKAQFPADGEWLEGHEKVFINGEPLLLRRCSIMCSYGGCVTILLSGQPE